MANWKQIQARIRKARVGADAIAKMTALYERTRDAMVAFELAKLYEAAGNTPDAAQWYNTSWQRFRRADWKKKAEEALARLGAPVPVAKPLAEGEIEEPMAMAAAAGASQPAYVETLAPSVGTEAAEENPEASVMEAQPQESASAESAAAAAQSRKRTRRGRRGGRRHRKDRVAAPAAVVPAAPPPGTPKREAPHRPAPARPAPVAPEEPVERGRFTSRTEEVIAREGRSRAGEPGLASRTAKLDSQLRRLLAAASHSLDEADTAPAGPGVLLLSDSELTTHYYVERADTLRVAMKFLSQGGRGRDRSEPLRSKLAEHLGIGDSQSKKYMQEHCAVRWLQLDEGASRLAHYAIAVLQPALNE